MKYWIGYLVAAIFAVITWAFTQFAKAHTILVDMIYPYMSRLIMTNLAQYNNGSSCVWQTLLILAVLALVATVVLMIVFRWNFFRWLGWVTAAVSCVIMVNTCIYGLNAYASPLADDMSLEVTDYTVSELNEATVFFRDKANELALTVERDAEGNVQFGEFGALAIQAADGFHAMTYEEAISVFAGSTLPVKKQFFFRSKGDTGIMVPLTGEACVNPKVPEVSLPFAMCKEMARRMCIYSDLDSNFAAFLAASHNESPEFQYSAYLMAYYYCYETLSAIPTSTARACAEQTEAGVNHRMKTDLEACRSFYDGEEQSNNVRADDAQKSDDEPALITFSSYTCSADLFASWYIQEYILPVHQEEEQPFDPYDPTQVDLTGIVNAPAPTEG